MTTPQFTMHHVAISVEDMNEAVAFYKVFGFNVVSQYSEPDGSLRIAHLALAGLLLEIFWYAEQSPAPRSAGELATDLARVGVKHFAMRVASIEEVRRYLLAAGITPCTETQRGRTGIIYFFVKDPSGNFVELVEDGRSLGG
jgi:glyoxylase I family protein